LRRAAQKQSREPEQRSRGGEEQRDKEKHEQRVEGYQSFARRYLNDATATYSDNTLLTL
jgi:hypothetical protein